MEEEEGYTCTICGKYVDKNSKEYTKRRKSLRLCKKCARLSKNVY